MSALKRGARGDEVKALQEMLSAAGYEVPATGVYGAWTERAVKAYQQKHGLGVDGIAGAKTFAALQPPLPRANPRALAEADVPAAAPTTPVQTQELQEMPAQEAAEPVQEATEPMHTGGLAQMFGAPGIGSDPDRNVADPGDPNFVNMLQAGGLAKRSNADRSALRDGGTPVFGTGAKLPPGPPMDGSSMATANSPFAGGLPPESPLANALLAFLRR